MHATKARPTSARSLALVLAGAVVVASACSHLVSAWLGLYTAAPSWVGLGPVDQPLGIRVYGSSLVNYGVDWPAIGREWQRRVESIQLPGGSMAEFPSLPPPPVPPSGDPIVTVLGVSVFDLNDFYLCDFRAEIVPLTRTIRELAEVGSDWHEAKHILSQYPLTYARRLFPTAGRSLGVMVGAREKARTLLSGADRPAEAATLNLQEEVKITDRIDQWPQARLLRNLAQLRAQCEGHHEFDGLKNLGLRQMLARASRAGPVLVVVLPVSASYRQAFVDPSVEAAYEKSLEVARHSAPSAIWIRLDRMPELSDDSNFWDPVHLNASAQAVATALVRERLSEVLPRS